MELLQDEAGVDDLGDPVAHCPVVLDIGGPPAGALDVGRLVEVRAGGREALLARQIGEAPPEGMRGGEGEPSAGAQHPGELDHETGAVGDEGGGPVGGEGDVEGVVGEGEAGRLRLEEGRRRSRRAGVDAAGGAQHPRGQVARDDARAGRGAPPAALRTPAAELEDVRAGEIARLAEHSQLLLGPPLGAPHEVGVP